MVELLPDAGAAQNIVLQERLEHLEEITRRQSIAIEQLIKNNAELNDRLFRLKEAIKEALARHQLVIDTYLDVDPVIFDENEEGSVLVRGAAKRRAIASKEHSTRLATLEEGSTDHEARLRSIEAGRKNQDTGHNKAHLDRLANELMVRSNAGQMGVTYAEAGKILKLKKARICQLRELISSDSRFNISWHPNRKNMKIICLKKNNNRRIV